MDNWEIQPKSTFNRPVFEAYGDKPMVKITPMGFVFSPGFCQSFGFKTKGCVVILLDQKANRIGFRAAINEADQNAGYKLVTRGKSLETTPSRLMKKIDEKYHGKFYQASMATGSNIIAIELNNAQNY